MRALLIVAACASLAACQKHQAAAPKADAAAPAAVASADTASAEAAPAEAATPAAPSNHVFKDANGVAIHGYDPVSFFAGAPAEGDAAFTSDYDGATFRFASADNKAKFDADPAHYAPQYGGYCAYGATEGGKYPTDPATGQIVNGKLYFNHDRNVQKVWNKDQATLIQKGDENWTRIVNDAPKG